MEKINKDNYFILYANCIPVKGYTRSLISDLQRQKIYYIPNDLFDVLTKIKTSTLLEIYNSYEIYNHPTLDEYFHFLMKNNLGFIDDNPNVFPSLNLEWDFPAKISNAIIDVDEKNISSVDYNQIFDELSRLNCFCVQIRSFEPMSNDTLGKLLNYTVDSRIKELRLVLIDNPKIRKYVADILIKKHRRISQVLFFNASSNEIESILGVQIINITKKRLSADDCGLICYGSFSVNIQHHTESLNFNSCLNRKISIDSQGDIKNCPSQKESFGNLKDSTLTETIKNQHFLKYWKIKKDDTSVCRDCEHRYICTDCRIFIEDDSDLFSKPSKCSYDPYSATWN